MGCKTALTYHRFDTYFTHSRDTSVTPSPHRPVTRPPYEENEENCFSNPQKITCIIFENLFGPYFLPHQSHSYGYAPSSGENLTSKI